MVYEVWLLHKDVLRRGHLFCNFFQVFTRQEKLCCGWRNIYTRVRKKSQYFTAGTEWISPPRAVYLMTRTGVCSECVCVRVCVLRVHGCVKEKFEGTPLHLVSTSTVVESHYPSWALWEFHQCVTSHLFTRLCGLHRVEQSRVSPRRHTTDPVTSSGLLFKSLSVCVRTVQGIKLSKLQFSHFHCFASVVHSSAIYMFSPINTATALPTGRELRRGGDLTEL